MKLLCALFGHKPPAYAKTGWYSPGEQYADISSGPTDGIGRVHCEVRGECARCGDRFLLCRVHLPETIKTEKLHSLVKILVADPIIHKGDLQGEYLRGMANGLICALAIFREWTPIYVESPKKEKV